MANKKKNEETTENAPATASNPAVFAPLVTPDVSKLSDEERARLTQFAPVRTARDERTPE